MEITRRVGASKGWRVIDSRVRLGRKSGWSEEECMKGGATVELAGWRIALCLNVVEIRVRKGGLAGWGMQMRGHGH